jgi:DNA-binding GntR family transcriptional regulator
VSFRDAQGVREGVPEFVRAYDALRALIATEQLAPGDPLPNEVELADRLGAHRPAVAEALLLLQEDGFLVRDRSRSFVVAPVRDALVGFADSFHRLLGDGARAVRRLHSAVETGSSWSRQLLQTDEECLVWETVFAHEGTLLASTLEWLLVSHAPPALLEQGDAREHDVETYPTLLEAVGPERRTSLSPLLWRLVQVSRNSERLSWMELPLHGIPAALTVVLADGGRPVYLAKNLFDLGTFNLTVDLSHGEVSVDLQPGGPA